MTNKAAHRLILAGSIIFWMVMVFSDLAILFSDLRGANPGVPEIMPHIMLDLFTVSVFFYYKLKIERDESLSFSDLLWKVFASGLVATVVSLFLRLIVSALGNSKLASNILFNYLIYQINFSMLLGFLLAAYTGWKRLIIYQKSKWVVQLWTAFDVTLVIALISDSLGAGMSSTFQNGLALILALMIVALSANMKWVAYLNFRQKLSSLLITLLIIFYLVYFSFTVFTYSESISRVTTAFLSFEVHIFNIGLFLFAVLYAVFSFLVILFNLPTSSVFEQKLEEAVNFQRLSQSIQTEQSEESVYRILLESSVSSVSADAAWLEIRQDGNNRRIFTFKISEDEVGQIRGLLREKKIENILETGPDKTLNHSRYMSGSGTSFRSILAFPIIVKGESIGSLALLKELPEGFNREMSRIAAAFANQAGISIENFRLMEEALVNERYQEELKIAKAVQKSLLPQKPEQASWFEMAAFSESADEVGGDYYDTLKISDSKVAGIIADVSGKGTTAAFHMSQMKGIFHSLAQDAADPKSFFKRANNALAHCLERGAFISAVYFIIDNESKTLTYARAGHCPVLFYHRQDNRTGFLSDKGTALGMIRNSGYENLIHTCSVNWHPGDIMVLYTDGITEARNTQGEEFGYDRLGELLKIHRDQANDGIRESMIRALHDFTETDELNDDHTMLIVKFK
jgi:sigma-B regulation protein RsbU (phosphoserine phosphatase)